MFKKYMTVDNSIINSMANPNVNAFGPVYANNNVIPIYNPGVTANYNPNQALSPDFAAYNPNQGQVYYGVPNINSGYPQNIPPQYDRNSMDEENNKPVQNDFGAPSLPQ